MTNDDVMFLWRDLLHQRELCDKNVVICDANNMNFTSSDRVYSSLIWSITCVNTVLLMSRHHQ